MTDDLSNPSLEPSAAGPGGSRPVVSPTRPRRNVADGRTRPATPQTSTETVGPSEVRSGPSVVALGGGHGLSIALQAARRYAGPISGVVSIADDGGSSGRLRQAYEAVPPGDVRRCLIALAGEDGPWTDAFGFRFSGGELDRHALGNLMLTALAMQLGSFAAAIRECERLLQSVGRVHTATVDPVVLSAIGPDGAVEGQRAVQSTPGLKHLELIPDNPMATPDALEAIRQADQVLIAPGSLFTSVLPVVCVPEIAAALAESPGRVIQIGNLVPEIPETEGLDAADHVRVLLDHGGRIDTYLADPAAELAFNASEIEALGITCITASVASAGARVHDPDGLARVLRALL